jgi:hypothetical protein
MPNIFINTNVNIYVNKYICKISKPNQTQIPAGVVAKAVIVFP